MKQTAYPENARVAWDIRRRELVPLPGKDYFTNAVRTSLALVLTRVNAPYSEQLDDAALAQLTLNRSRRHRRPSGESESSLMKRTSNLTGKK